MMIVVAEAVADRVHGFLGSLCLNVHPGVYVSGVKDPAFRSRMIAIMRQWHDEVPEGRVVFIWRSPHKPLGIDIETIGEPKREIIELDGHYAVKRVLEAGSLDGSGTS